MKKMIYLLFICCLLVSNTMGCSKKAESASAKVSVSNTTTSSDCTDKAPEHSHEELNQDIFVTLLNPYIQKAINHYYGQFLTISPFYSLEDVEILDVERPMDYRSFSFIIKLQIRPYVGPHVEVGVDQLTVRVGAGEGEVVVEKLEHIKSYFDKLPLNMKDIVKNVS